MPSSRPARSTPPRDIPADTPLDQLEFAVVDVETTGLSADRGDRVCEIGVVRLRGGAVLSTFGSLIDPTIPVSAGAYAVNGISPAMLAGAPRFPDVLPRVAELFEGSVIAAYNAPFDVAFLESEFRLGGAPAPGNPVVDVLPLARRLLPGRRGYRQEAVAALLRISGRVRHRALEDALVTAQILSVFLSLLKAHGRSSFGDLLRPDLGAVIARERRSRIAGALASGGDLWIRYLSPVDGEVTQRIVTPVGGSGPGADAGPGAVLEAFCHVLQDRRRFQVEYILDVRPVPPAA